MYKSIMKYFDPLIAAVTIFCCVFILQVGHSFAQSQKVWVEPENDTVFLNEAVMVDLLYRPSDDNSKMAGIILRIHFNGNVISFMDFKNLFLKGFQFDDAIHEDIEDFDNDPKTNKYILLFWVDMFGKWPGQIDSWPLSLAQMKFLAKNTGISPINVSIKETQTGYQAEGESSEISVIH